MQVACIGGGGGDGALDQTALDQTALDQTALDPVAPAKEGMGHAFSFGFKIGSPKAREHTKSTRQSPMQRERFCVARAHTHANTALLSSACERAESAQPRDIACYACYTPHTTRDEESLTRNGSADRLLPRRSGVGSSEDTTH